MLLLRIRDRKTMGRPIELQTRSRPGSDPQYPLTLVLFPHRLLIAHRGAH
jgi:hypothetical protein